MSSRFTFCLAIVILLAATPAAAATITAGSCNNTRGSTDVQDAIDRASTGDIVELPAGTCDWTVAVSVGGKSIVVRGAGIDATIIQDTVGGALSTGASPTGGYLRLTGLTFKWNQRSRNVAAFPAVSVSGLGAWRMDRVKFTGYASGNWRGQLVKVVNARPCLLDNIQGSFGHVELLQVEYPHWNGKNTPMGHSSWASPASFGTDQACYVEDSIFTNTTSIGQSLVEGNGGGGRYVVRFSTITGYSMGAHGAGSSEKRGLRHYEAYNNIFDRGSTKWDKVAQFRSGEGHVHHNTMQGTPFNTYLKLWAERCCDPVGSPKNKWAGEGRAPGGANGRSYWDNNDTTGGPNNDGVHESGTAGEGSGLNVLEDSTKAWTTNQWRGYVLTDTKNGRFSTITSNTATSLTTSATTFGANHTFTSGHPYEIRKVNYILDQPGRGQSNDLSEYRCARCPTSSVGYTAVQAPVYMYKMSGTAPGASVQRVPGGTLIGPEGKDYCTDRDGSTCVTSGEDPPRGSCTPLRGYWRTTGGTWNKSNGKSPYGVATALSGMFYQCGQDGQWPASPTYVPLEYPHPLRVSGPLARTPTSPARASRVAAMYPLNTVEVRDPADLEYALTALVKGHADAIAVLEEAMLIAQAGRIADLARKHHLPGIGFTEYARAGGLLGFGVSFPALWRRAAGFVDKIFKGAKPRDLPIEQATKFEVVINLTAAKALGLTVPPSLLLRADEVIE